MNCRDFEEIAGLFLDDELTGGESQSALDHFETCLNCREKINADLLLKNRLRLAIKENPAVQLNKIQTEDILRRAKLKAIPARSSFNIGLSEFIFSKALIPSTAGLLLIALGIFAFVRYNSQETQVTTIEPPVYTEVTGNPNATKIAWRELMTSAVNEHENCTLNHLNSEHHKISERIKNLSDSEESLEGLVQTSLQKNLSKNVKLADSHLCESNSKRYTHLVFQNVNKYISVMISSFEGLTDSEETMYCESNKNYQVACFTAKNQTVFVISDLSEPENVKLARSISPEVRQYFRLSKNNL